MTAQAPALRLGIIDAWDVIDASDVSTRDL
jgi:hypothetical protein